MLIKMHNKKLLKFIFIFNLFIQNMIRNLFILHLELLEIIKIIYILD